jgi:hypothetical protein
MSTTHGYKSMHIPAHADTVPVGTRTPMGKIVILTSHTTISTL